MIKLVGRIFILGLALGAGVACQKNGKQTAARARRMPVIALPSTPHKTLSNQRKRLVRR